MTLLCEVGPKWSNVCMFVPGFGHDAQAQPIGHFSIWTEPGQNIIKFRSSSPGRFKMGTLWTIVRHCVQPGQSNLKSKARFTRNYDHFCALTRVFYVILPLNLGFGFAAVIKWRKIDPSLPMLVIAGACAFFRDVLRCRGQDDLESMWNFVSLSEVVQGRKHFVIEIAHFVISWLQLLAGAALDNTSEVGPKIRLMLVMNTTFCNQLIAAVGWRKHRAVLNTQAR